MSTAAIIAEYNPFHNGHVFHIEETRRMTGASQVVVIMSGDYVQRGTPAVFDKYLRTRAALREGADLVIELPTAVSTGSAEIFAEGAVRILNSLPFVDFLSFGSEEGELAPLQAIADVLADEPREFREVLKEELKSGRTYAEARSTALTSILGASCEALLAEPNNILAIEYLKALKKTGSRMKPFTLPRKPGSYHDTALVHYASATALRKSIADGEDFSVGVPSEINALYRDYLSDFSYLKEDDMSVFLNARLITEPDLTVYTDVSREIADRIDHHRTEFLSYTDWIRLTKTRQYPYSRIARVFAHILLDIRDEEVTLWRGETLPYIRVLGIRRDSGITPQLKGLETPLLINYTDRRDLPAEALAVLAKEEARRNLYRLALHEKCGVTLPDEVHAGPIFL